MRRRRRARLIGALALALGVVLYLYAGSLAAFQMGGSCKEFGLTVRDWNCRQASIYAWSGIILTFGGIAAIGLSFVRRQR